MEKTNTLFSYVSLIFFLNFFNVSCPNNVLLDQNPVQKAEFLISIFSRRNFTQSILHKLTCIQERKILRPRFESSQTHLAWLIVLKIGKEVLNLTEAIVANSCKVKIQLFIFKIFFGQTTFRILSLANF